MYVLKFCCSISVIPYLQKPPKDSKTRLKLINCSRVTSLAARVILIAIYVDILKFLSLHLVCFGLPLGRSGADESAASFAHGTS